MCVKCVATVTLSKLTGERSLEFTSNQGPVRTGQLVILTKSCKLHDLQQYVNTTRVSGNHLIYVPFTL